MPLYTSTFYHGLMRKYVVAFGNLFTSIEVIRHKSDGSEDHRARVPLSYGPKDKWVIRLLQDPDQQRQTAIDLPRMGFEVTGMAYDPSRKQPNNVRVRYTDPLDVSKNAYLYQPVPYNIQFQLHVLSKYIDEGSQIIEQIVPIFTPDYTVTIQTIDEIQKLDDIPISLVDVQSEDNYDGKFTTRRAIIWSLAFNMKAWFYGPMPSSAVIKTADVNLWQMDVE